MEFLEHFISYYQSEYKAGYFIGTVVAGLLLLSGLLLRKLSNPLSLFNGLAVPLLVTGLFMGIAGNATGYFTHKTFVKKEVLFNKDKKAFFMQEVPKTEKTHRSWFGIRLGWSVVVAVGGLLLMITKKDYYVGVGIGILISGMLGHVEEAISFKRNERYYRAVMQAARQSSILLPDSLSTGKLLLHKNFPLTYKINQFSKPLADQLIGSRDKIRMQAAVKTNSVYRLNTAVDSLAERQDQSDSSEVILNRENIPALQYSGIRLLDYDNQEISEVAKDKRFNEYDGAILMKQSRQRKRCWLGSVFN